MKTNDWKGVITAVSELSHTCIIDVLNLTFSHFTVKWCLLLLLGGGELQLDSCMQSQFCTDSNTASLNVNEH